MKQKKVAVCIPACKRPQSLRLLLQSLSKLQFNKILSLNLIVVVVDNDFSGSSKTVTGHYASCLQLIYAIEPVQNISLARNKAVAIAREAGCEYIAFVDDDEFVDPFWLDELLSTQEKYAADLVIGPVIPVFPGGVPDWIIKGGFFNRKRYTTGEKIRWGSTGNVLIKCELLDRLDIQFDHKFGLTGGEDTHFFERLYRLGAKMIWSDEAVIRENIPLSRANIRWLLRRSHFGGNTLALTEKDLAPSKNWAIFRFLKGIGRILQGCMLLLPSLLFGRTSAVKSLSCIARGAGMLTGIFGLKFEEYKIIHGS